MKIENFLKTMPLQAYREKYNPVKIVEQDLSREIQVLDIFYDIYWTQKNFLTFQEFFKTYFNAYKDAIDYFALKCGYELKWLPCFYKGLEARTYRTWASLLTQTQLAYLAKDCFPQAVVEMGSDLDHKGIDLKIGDKPYQVKKVSLRREIRERIKDQKGITLIQYVTPIQADFDNPLYKRTKQLKEVLKNFVQFNPDGFLDRLENGFVIFTPKVFGGENA